MWMNAVMEFLGGRRWNWGAEANLDRSKAMKPKA
jgi:hypothetical protein